MMGAGRALLHADFSPRADKPAHPRDGDGSDGGGGFTEEREADGSRGIWRSRRQPRNELYFIGLT